MELLRVTPVTQDRSDTNSSVLKKIFQLRFFQTPLHKPLDERHELQPPARPAALVTNSTVAENVEYLIDGHAAFKISKACFVVPGMSVPDQHLSAWTTSHKERIEDEILTWIRQFCDRAHVELQMVRDKSGKVGPCVLLICWNDACCDTEARREALKTKVQKKLRRQQSMQSCPFPCLTVIEKTVLKSRSRIVLPLLQGPDCVVNTPKRPAWPEVNHLIGAGIDHQGRRLSTLGGVLWIHGVQYAMTALHPFYSLSSQACRSLADGQESSEESRSVSPSGVEDSDDDTDDNLFNGSTENFSFTSLERQSSQSVLVSASLDLRQRERRSHDAAYPLNSIITGETITTSTGTPLSGDWLLLKLKDDRSFRANGYIHPTTGSRILLNEIAPQLPTHGTTQGTDVCVLAGDFGTLSAKIGQTRIKMLVSGLQLSVFRICLKMPLPSGASGSWVVKDNAVIGFVVAGQERWPIAYCVSFRDFIGSLRSTIGDVQVSLEHGLIELNIGDPSIDIINTDTTETRVSPYFSLHGDSQAATEPGPSTVVNRQGPEIPGGNGAEIEDRNLRIPQSDTSESVVNHSWPYRQPIASFPEPQVDIGHESVANLQPHPKYGGYPKAERESPGDPGSMTPDPIGLPGPKTATRRVVDGVLAAITFFILSLAAVGVAPQGPQILRELGAESEILDTLLISAYTGSAVAAPLGVSISRSFNGNYWMDTLSWGFFALWNSLSVHADNTPVLFVYRTLAGLSAGCLVHSTLEHSQIRILSFEGLAASTAACIGLLIGPATFGQASKRAFFLAFASLGLFMSLVSAVLLFVGPRTKPKFRTEYFFKRLLFGLRYALTATWKYQWRPHLGKLADPLYAFFILYASALLGCVIMLHTSLASAMRQPPNAETYLIEVALMGPGWGALAGLWPFVFYRSDLKRKDFDHGDRKSALRELSRLILANTHLAVGLFWYGWTIRTLSSPVTAILGNAWAAFSAVSSLIHTAKFMSITFDETIQRHTIPLVVMFGSAGTVTFSLVEQQVRQSIGFGATSSLFAGLILTCGVLLIIARIWHRPVFDMSKSLHSQLDLLPPGDPESRAAPGPRPEDQDMIVASMFARLRIRS